MKNSSHASETEAGSAFKTARELLRASRQRESALGKRVRERSGGAILAREMESPAREEPGDRKGGKGKRHRLIRSKGVRIDCRCNKKEEADAREGDRERDHQLSFVSIIDAQTAPASL